VLPGYEGRATPPSRRTPGSAGYDLAAAEDVVVPPRGVALVPTGLRAVMGPGEFLALYVRSSLAVRRGLMLANGTGIVDQDYAGNPDNGGHILVALYNPGDAPVHVARGERVAQGIFQRFLVVDEEAPPGGPREGGFGSTGRF
jgi:dUTP pyrophosphatase